MTGYRGASAGEGARRLEAWLGRSGFAVAATLAVNRHANGTPPGDDQDKPCCRTSPTEKAGQFLLSPGVPVPDVV